MRAGDWITWLYTPPSGGTVFRIPCQVVSVSATAVKVHLPWDLDGVSSIPLDHVEGLEALRAFEKESDRDA